MLLNFFSQVGLILKPSNRAVYNKQTKHFPEDWAYHDKQLQPYDDEFQW